MVNVLATFVVDPFNCHDGNKNTTSKWLLNLKDEKNVEAKTGF